MSLVEFAIEDEIAIVTINRPEARNAVDQPTAAALADAFRRFDADDALSVAILTGAGGTFCAGADLKAVATSSRQSRDREWRRAARMHADAAEQAGDRSGRRIRRRGRNRARAVVRSARRRARRDLRRVLPTLRRAALRRRHDSIAAADRDEPRDGHDPHRTRSLRRRGIRDGPGESRRRAGHGAGACARARQADRELPAAMHARGRMSAYEAWTLPLDDALKNEYRYGIATIESGETRAGAERFASGIGRHGKF